MKPLNRQTRNNLILYVLILFCNYNWAQQNQTFNIISQFEPNVKNGNKLSSSPELPDTSVQETSLSLGILPNPSQFVINPEPIAAATLKPKPERLRPKALISVGLAPIYLMPIISAHYASQPNRNGMWGLSVSHVSADYKTDKTLLNNFSNTECAAYGIQHIKLLTLQPDFVYRRNINYFFNTSTNFALQVPEMDRESSIWQQMQTLAPSLALQSHYTDSTKINFNALARSQITQRNMLGSSEWEQNLLTHVKADRWINHEHVMTELTLNYLSYSPLNKALVTNNFMGILNPYFNTCGKHWQSRVGFKLAVEHTRITAGANTSPLTYIYPDLEASYALFPGWLNAQIKLYGNLHQTSMTQLYQTNNFISNQVLLKNTNMPLRAEFKLDGKTRVKSDYGIQTAWTQYKNAIVFERNLKFERYMFDPTYKDYAALSIRGYWQQEFSLPITLHVSGEWYRYQAKKEIQLQYLPDYSLQFNVKYQYSSKLSCSGIWYVLGGQQFINYTQNKPPLPAWSDVNINLEYQHTRVLKYFFRLHNVINQNTYRWENYPQQQFNFVFGASFNPLKS